MVDIKNFNKTFITGFVALLPIMATFYLFIWVMGVAESFLGGLLKFILPDQWYMANPSMSG